MDWVSVRAKILTVVRSCTRAQTVWRDREQPFTVPVDWTATPPDTTPDANAQVTVKLHMTVPERIHRDEFRQQLNLVTNKLEFAQIGNRKFTVSALVESFDQSDTRHALVYTERLRNCLDRPQVLAMFREVNLTCVGVSAPVDLSRSEDDHIVSVASVDLFFTYRTVDTDGPGMEPIDWIETVQPLDWEDP